MKIRDIPNSARRIRPKNRKVLDLVTAIVAPSDWTLETAEFRTDPSIIYYSSHLSEAYLAGTYICYLVLAWQWSVCARMTEYGGQCVTFSGGIRKVPPGWLSAPFVYLPVEHSIADWSLIFYTQGKKSRQSPQIHDSSRILLITIQTAVRQ